MRVWPYFVVILVVLGLHLLNLINLSDWGEPVRIDDLWAYVIILWAMIVIAIREAAEWIVAHVPNGKFWQDNR